MDRYPTPYPANIRTDFPMHINKEPANIAGIKNIIFDRRKFEPSRNDVEDICRFFSIGKLQYYEKDKDINIYHRNPFVFVVTTRGQFALKFYSTGKAPQITTEYVLNRILLNHRFPTPTMHAGHRGQPFLASNSRLVTCFSYINGLQSWQCIKQRNTIRKINAVMLSLKNILSTIGGRIPFRKRKGLATTITALAQNFRAIASYNQEKMIEAYLLDVFRIYQRYQPLFIRQWLHNHANPCNFLIYKKNAYLLDLEHIREDYALSDLASLVISCLFLKMPVITIKTIVNDYFAQHKIKSDHILVLNTLLKIKLIGEYLEIIQCEKSITPSAYPPSLMPSYKFHISASKESITAVLKKMNDISNFII